MNIRSIVMAALVAASVVSAPAYAEGKIETAIKKCGRIAWYTAFVGAPVVATVSFYLEHVESTNYPFDDEGFVHNWLSYVGFDDSSGYRKPLTVSSGFVFLASMGYGLQGLKKEIYDPMANRAVKKKQDDENLQKSSMIKRYIRKLWRLL